MNTHWITLFTTSNPIEAELVKQALEEHNVEAIVLNKQDSSYLFGEVQVLVRAKDAENAQLYLKNNPI